MASSNLSKAIFIFSLLFFSSFASACVPCTYKAPPPVPQLPPPAPKLSPPKPLPPPAPKLSPPKPPPVPKLPPPAPKLSPPKPLPPPAPKLSPPKPPPVPELPPPVPELPPPAPKLPPPAITPPPATCPKDILKLGVCADLLGGVVGVIVGTPLSSKCCALLEGLADLEVALCLCTAIKANVLGINLNIPVALSLVLSACQKTVPPGFQC